MHAALRQLKRQAVISAAAASAAFVAFKPFAAFYALFAGTATFGAVFANLVDFAAFAATHCICAHRHSLIDPAGHHLKHGDHGRGRHEKGSLESTEFTIGFASFGGLSSRSILMANQRRQFFFFSKWC